MPKQPNDRTNRSRLGSVFSRLFGIKPARAPRIEPRKDGFEVFDLDQAKWHLRWDEVTAVVAFKLDRITTDTICFGFRRSGEGDDTLWCIDEDWPGYKRIVDGIEALTEGAWPARFGDVAQPPFAYNWTELWYRAGSEPLPEHTDLIWLDRGATERQKLT